MKRTATMFVSDTSICNGTAPEITCTNYTQAYVRGIDGCRTIWTDGEQCFYVLYHGFFVKVSHSGGNIWRITY